MASEEGVTYVASVVTSEKESNECPACGREVFQAEARLAGNLFLKFLAESNIIFKVNVRFKILFKTNLDGCILKPTHTCGNEYSSPLLGKHYID